MFVPSGSGIPRDYLIERRLIIERYSFCIEDKDSINNTAKLIGVINPILN